MRKETRKRFNEYVKQVASLNGVDDATVKFAVEPSVQQKVEARAQESSDFLKSINIIGVTEQQGEKLGLGIGAPIASTTDTTTKDRQTVDPTNLDGGRYNATQTNSDTHVKYAKLDAWAHLSQFQTLIRDAILARRALDRILIGFNGVTRAATSDRVANPLLQDVNIGWLQQWRDNAPQRVMSTGTKVAGKVTVGATGDYKNLDALVMDAIANLIDPWFRRDGGLVVILGDDLLHDKYFPLVNKDNPATESLATDMILSQRRVGGKQAVTVPGFPAKAMAITRLDNLSLYYQLGAMRRTIVDNAKRDQIENFESSNDAYVVEDYGLGCVIENIELV